MEASEEDSILDGTKTFVFYDSQLLGRSEVRSRSVPRRPSSDKPQTAGSRKQVTGPGSRRSQEKNEEDAEDSL